MANTIGMWRAATFAALLLLSSLVVTTEHARAGEKLVYSVTQEQEILRTRHFTHTDVYAIEPGQSRGTLIFTDAGTDIVLLPTRPSGERDQVMVSGGRRVFARGIERTRYPGAWYERPAAIHELSIDGSNRWRKVFDLEGEQRLSRLFLHPDGTRIGYLNEIGNTPFLFIHDSAGGELKHRLDLRRILLDCFVRNIGWAQDGASLFFTLETGDVHVTSEASYKRAGSYRMREDGSGLQRISAGRLAGPLPQGYREDASLQPVVLAAGTGGKLLVRRFAWDTKSRGNSPSLFLEAAASGSAEWRRYPLGRTTGLFWFVVSPSGRHLAYTSQTADQPNEEVWAVDLDSGKEVSLFVLPTKPLVPPYLSLIGWISE